jgi:hypothetical protein
MAGTSENPHIALYRLIMTEIKERCAVLETVADQKVNVWSVAAYEMGYLQLRLICELIALGCLAAHGDLPATYSKRLLKTYEPGRIFAELTKLHSNFYPRACSKEVMYQSGQTTVKVLEDHSYLSKKELIALHGETGNVLHRGRLGAIGRGFHLDFGKIQEYRNKLVDMLRVHLIALYDQRRYVLIIMSDPNTGNVGASEITVSQVSDGWAADEARRRQSEKRG